MDTHGDGLKRQRIHRDLFLLIGGTIEGKYQPHPAYYDHVCYIYIVFYTFFSLQDALVWRELQMLQLPAPMVYHAVTVLNGILYVFGGGDTQEAYSKKM